MITWQTTDYHTILYYIHILGFKLRQYYTLFVYYLCILSLYTLYIYYLGILFMGNLCMLRNDHLANLRLPRNTLLHSYLGIQAKAILYSLCILSLYTLSVYSLCILSGYTLSVYSRCILFMYTLCVYSLCIVSL